MHSPIKTFCHKYEKTVTTFWDIWFELVQLIRNNLVLFSFFFDFLTFLFNEGHMVIGSLEFNDHIKWIIRNFGKSNLNNYKEISHIVFSQV